MSDTSTRQRLLELWKKCPECKVKTITGVHDYMEAKHLPKETLEALARDAMAEYLVTPTRWIEASKHYNNKDHLICVRQEDTPVGENHAVGRGSTRTDALISAVEAVLASKETQDV